MKKRFGFVWFIVLSVVFVTWSGPVQAAYTVTGDITSGWGTTGGSLWYDVFKETSTSSAGGYDGEYTRGVLYRPATTISNKNPKNATNHNWIEGDYVVVTGTSGTALYSVGELDPRFGNSTVSLTDNDSDGLYDLSGAGRSVTGVTSIEVIHASDVLRGFTGTYSDSITVSGNEIITKTYTDGTGTGTPLSMLETVTYGARKGPTLLTVLDDAGADTSNMFSYLIATSSDGYCTVLSMYEVTHLNTEINYGGSAQSVLDMLSLNESKGYARLVLPGDVNNGRWCSYLSNIEIKEINAVPLPTSLFLLAPGLLTLIGLRKRIRR